MKNVTELGTHGRRNSLPGREFMSTVCQEEKERERKDSGGNIYSVHWEKRQTLKAPNS